MRSISLIVLHCSATRTTQNYSFRQCKADHMKLGYKTIGYHYYITRDGHTYQTRHEQLIGAHAKGYNEHSLGVCYEGGIDPQGKHADTRTPRQKQALLRLLKRLKAAHPGAAIVGHRDLPDVHKDCPCFDATEYSRL